MVIPWETIQSKLAFTGVKDVGIWQDVFISSLVLPAVFALYRIIGHIWSHTRPLNLLLKGLVKESEIVQVFLSQLSAINTSLQLNPAQQYIIRYPNPQPNDNAHLNIEVREKIDPVWSEADGECLSDIFNVLGTADKTRNIKLSDMLKDWDSWTYPTFSIGFNPKTLKLMERCSPVYFWLNGVNLCIKSFEKGQNCYVPNDAGVVQKTFIKDTKVPVFILAGMGTTGTSASGYFFRENSVKIGKMFGNKPFCFLVKVRVDEGVTSTQAIAVHPKPTLYNIIMHPVVYWQFMKPIIKYETENR